MAEKGAGDAAEVEAATLGENITEDCTHVDEDGRPTIRVVGDDFPGYYSCSLCGHPFVSALPIVAHAREVVRIHGMMTRAPSLYGVRLMAAVDVLRRSLPAEKPADG